MSRDELKSSEPPTIASHPKLNQYYFDNSIRYQYYLPIDKVVLLHLYSGSLISNASSMLRLGRRTKPE